MGLMKWKFAVWRGVRGNSGVTVGVVFGQKGKHRYIAISQAFYGLTESGSHGLRGVGIYN